MRKDYRGREYCNETDTDSITELLIGRRVVEVDNRLLTLDDGTVLEVVPNEGCGGWWTAEDTDTGDFTDNIGSAMIVGHIGERRAR